MANNFTNISKTNNDIIQLLTFVEVNIRIYRSKIYDIYRSRSRGKYHISWNDRSLYYTFKILFLYLFKQIQPVRKTLYGPVGILYGPPWFQIRIRRPDGFCCLFSKSRLEGSPACPRLNLSRLWMAKMPNQQIIQPSML